MVIGAGAGAGQPLGQTGEEGVGHGQQGNVALDGLERGGPGMRVQSTHAREKPCEIVGFPIVTPISHL